MTSSAHAPDPVLCIRLSAMGDVAMLVPVFLSLTAKYPKVRLTLLSKPQFRPIFESIPQVQFVEAEVKGKHSGALGLLKLYRLLDTKEFSAVADLHQVIRSSVLRGFFRLSGKKTAVIDKGRSEKKHLTQPQPKTLTYLKSTHQRYADVFAKLGLPFPLIEDAFVKKKPLPANFRPKEEKTKWLGIAPFAAHPGKAYPEDLMYDCIKQLAAKDIRVFLFGAPGPERDQLARLADPFDRVESLAGKMDFDEELAVISNLDLMLAMDSGNGHLAAMYGVPVITLWGVTHPCLGFAPYGQPQENQLTSSRELYPLIPTSVYGNKVPKGYEDAMRSISVEEVVSAVMRVLYEAPRI